MSKKISQLDPLSIATSNDLLAIVNADETKKITVGGLLSTATKVSPNVLYVSKSGDDANGDGSLVNPYLTIKAAVASVVAPTATNSYTIYISPGEYTEVNPIDVPSYVNIEGMGGLGANRIQAGIITQPLFRPYPFSSLKGLTLYGVTNNSAVLFSQPGIALVSDILIRDCFYGIRVNNSSALVSAKHITFATDVIATDTVIYVESGQVNIHNLSTLSIDATTLVHVDGPTSSVNSWQIHSDNTVDLTNGIYVTNSARFTGNDISVGAKNIVRTNTGGFVAIVGISSIRPISTYDILQEDSNSTISMQGNLLHEDRFSIANWDNIAISYKSLEEGDEAHVFNEEIHVGSPQKGSETCMGEGDSTSRGMMVYTYDGVSTYTDVSIAASSASASTFTMGTTTGSELLLSWDLLSADYLRFYGLKLAIATGGTAGGGDYVWEYWDGGAWIDFKTMITDANSPYLPHGSSFFESAGVFQIRFDAYLAETGKWMKNDPISEGTPRYWMRVRITADMTTSPIMEQIKLHTSRYEVNSDGWVEYFGKARPQGTLPWDLGLMAATSGGVPGSQNLYLTNTIGAGRDNNLLVKNVVDRMGLLTNLPFDFDTSTPLKFEWYWTSDGTGGKVHWVIRWAYTKNDDDIHYASGSAPGTIPNSGTLDIISTVTGDANKQRSESALLDFSSAISRRDGGSGDLIWITIERKGDDAVDDTHNSDSALIHISPTYIKWCEGGHIIV